MTEAVRVKSREGSPRLLVVGCGNPLAGDDNVGLELVRRLQGRGGYGCEFRNLPDGPLDLLELFDCADVMLFVDAVQSGVPPGTLHLVPLPSRSLMPRVLGAVSSHGWGLDEALRLALALGRNVPRLMLLGVELESVAPGTPRTAPVDAALEVVVEHFPQLQAALQKGESPLWSRHHSYVPGQGHVLEFSSATPARVRESG